MIPKIIHYCWFDNENMNNLVKRCISSWKAYLPDYRLKKWDESNCPLDTAYTRQALAEKKWSKVSNYIRLYALYHEGGIYFDTEVEVTQSFDPLLTQNLFLGFQFQHEHIDWVNNAVIGSLPGHPFLKECMVMTENALIFNHYYYRSPEMTTLLLKKKGLRRYGFQKIDDITLYPVDYFYPYSVAEKFDPTCITNNTFCIHHWESSWLPPLEEAPISRINRFVNKLRTKMNLLT